MKVRVLFVQVFLWLAYDLTLQLSKKTSRPATRTRSRTFLRRNSTSSQAVRIPSCFFQATLVLFNAAVPEDDASAPISPQGTVPNPYSFALSKANATQSSGGSVKIVDSRSFTVSSTIAMAEVTVEPGAMRYLCLTFGIIHFLLNHGLLENCTGIQLWMNGASLCVWLCILMHFCPDIRLVRVQEE